MDDEDPSSDNDQENEDLKRDQQSDSYDVIPSDHVTPKIPIGASSTTKSHSYCDQEVFDTSTVFEEVLPYGDNNNVNNNNVNNNNYHQPRRRHSKKNRNNNNNNNVNNNNVNNNNNNSIHSRSKKKKASFRRTQIKLNIPPKDVQSPKPPSNRYMNPPNLQSRNPPPNVQSPFHNPYMNPYQPPHYSYPYMYHYHHQYAPPPPSHHFMHQTSFPLRFNQNAPSPHRFNQNGPPPPPQRFNQNAPPHRFNQNAPPPPPQRFNQNFNSPPPTCNQHFNSPPPQTLNQNSTSPHSFNSMKQFQPSQQRNNTNDNDTNNNNNNNNNNYNPYYNNNNYYYASNADNFDECYNSNNDNNNNNNNNANNRRRNQNNYRQRNQLQKKVDYSEYVESDSESTIRKIEVPLMTWKETSVNIPELNRRQSNQLFNTGDTIHYNMEPRYNITQEPSFNNSQSEPAQHPYSKLCCRCGYCFCSLEYVLLIYFDTYGKAVNSLSTAAQIQLPTNPTCDALQCPKCNWDVASYRNFKIPLFHFNNISFVLFHIFVYFLLHCLVFFFSIGLRLVLRSEFILSLLQVANLPPFQVIEEPDNNNYNNNNNNNLKRNNKKRKTHYVIQFNCVDFVNNEPALESVLSLCRDRNRASKLMMRVINYLSWRHILGSHIRLHVHWTRTKSGFFVNIANHRITNIHPAVACYLLTLIPANSPLQQSTKSFFLFFFFIFVFFCYFFLLHSIKQNKCYS